MREYCSPSRLSALQRRVCGAVSVLMGIRGVACTEGVSSGSRAVTTRTVLHEEETGESSLRVRSQKSSLLDLYIPSACVQCTVVLAQQEARSLPSTSSGYVHWCIGVQYQCYSTDMAIAPFSSLLQPYSCKCNAVLPPVVGLVMIRLKKASGVIPHSISHSLHHAFTHPIARAFPHSRGHVRLQHQPGRRG